MKLPRILKHFAALLAVIYFVQNVALLHAVETNIWESRRASLGRQAVAQQRPLAGGLGAVWRRPTAGAALEQVIAPFASIIDISISKVPNPKTVFLIQDIHLHLEAQNNIAGTITALARAAGQNLPSPDRAQPSGKFRPAAFLVGLEGAHSDRINFSAYNAYPYRTVLNQVAQKYLKANILNGVEYAAIGYKGEGDGEVELPFEVTGIEDEAEYQANIQTIRDAAPLKAEAEASLANLKQSIANKKLAITTPVFAAFDAKSIAFEEGTLSVPEYANYLNSVVSASSPNAQRLLKAAALEKTINFEQAERERAAMLASVNAGGSANVSQYPQLGRYLDYVRLAQEINPGKLMREMKTWETQAQEKLITNKTQVEVLESQRDYFLLKKLTSHTLTSEDWKEYLSRHPGTLLGRDPGFPTENLGPTSSFNKLGGRVTKFEAFYRLAIQRNHTMVERFVHQFKHSDTKTAALVAGGFHSDGLRELLIAQGFTVLTVSPKITQIDANNPSSVEILASNRLPLDQLFVGERLFIPLPASTDGPRAEALQEKLLNESEIARTGQASAYHGYHPLLIFLEKTSEHGKAILRLWIIQMQSRYSALTTKAKKKFKEEIKALEIANRSFNEYLLTDKRSLLRLATGLMPAYETVPGLAAKIYERLNLDIGIGGQLQRQTEMEAYLQGLIKIHTTLNPKNYAVKILVDPQDWRTSYPIEHLAFDPETKKTTFIAGTTGFEKAEEALRSFGLDWDENKKWTQARFMFHELVESLRIKSDTPEKDEEVRLIVHELLEQHGMGPILNLVYLSYHPDLLTTGGMVRMVRKIIIDNKSLFRLGALKVFKKPKSNLLSILLPIGILFLLTAGWGDSSSAGIMLAAVVAMVLPPPAPSSDDQRKLEEALNIFRTKDIGQAWAADWIYTKAHLLTEAQVVDVAQFIGTEGLILGWEAQHSLVLALLSHPKHSFKSLMALASFLEWAKPSAGDVVGWIDTIVKREVPRLSIAEQMLFSANTQALLARLKARDNPSSRWTPDQIEEALNVFRNKDVGQGWASERILTGVVQMSETQIAEVAGFLATPGVVRFDSERFTLASALIRPGLRKSQKSYELLVEAFVLPENQNMAAPLIWQCLMDDVGCLRGHPRAKELISTIMKETYGSEAYDLFIQRLADERIAIARLTELDPAIKGSLLKAKDQLEKQLTSNLSVKVTIQQRANGEKAVIKGRAQPGEIILVVGPEASLSDLIEYAHEQEFKEICDEAKGSSHFPALILAPFAVGALDVGMGAAVAVALAVVGYWYVKRQRSSKVEPTVDPATLADFLRKLPKEKRRQAAFELSEKLRPKLKRLNEAYEYLIKKANRRDPFSDEHLRRKDLARSKWIELVAIKRVIFDLEKLDADSHGKLINDTAGRAAPYIKKSWLKKMGPALVLLALLPIFMGAGNQAGANEDLIQSLAVIGIFGISALLAMIIRGYWDQYQRSLELDMLFHTMPEQELNDLAAHFYRYANDTEQDIQEFYSKNLLEKDPEGSLSKLRALHFTFSSRTQNDRFAILSGVSYFQNRVAYLEERFGMAEDFAKIEMRPLGFWGSLILYATVSVIVRQITQSDLAFLIILWVFRRVIGDLVREYARSLRKNHMVLAFGALTLLFAGGASATPGPAMRWSGLGLTERQHKEAVNVATRLYFNGERNYDREDLAFDSEEYRTLDPEGLLRKNKVNIYFLTGWKLKIAEMCHVLGLDGLADLVSHPGRRRRQIYIDPEDFKVLKQMGPEWLAKWARHELAHIENPKADEVDVQTIASLPDSQDAKDGLTLDSTFEEVVHHVYQSSADRMAILVNYRGSDTVREFLESGRPLLTEKEKGGIENYFLERGWSYARGDFFQPNSPVENIIPQLHSKINTTVASLAFLTLGIRTIQDLSDNFNRFSRAHNLEVTTADYFKRVLKLYGYTPNETPVASAGGAMRWTGLGILGKQLDEVIRILKLLEMRVPVRNLKRRFLQFDSDEYRTVDPNGVLAASGKLISITTGFAKKSRIPDLVSFAGPEVIDIDADQYSVAKDFGPRWWGKWAAHELAHYQYPDYAEWEIQKIAPLPSLEDNLTPKASAISDSKEDLTKDQRFRLDVTRYWMIHGVPIRFPSPRPSYFNSNPLEIMLPRMSSVKIQELLTEISQNLEADMRLHFKHYLDFLRGVFHKNEGLSFKKDVVNNSIKRTARNLLLPFASLRLAEPFLWHAGFLRTDSHGALDEVVNEVNASIEWLNLRVEVVRPETLIENNSVDELAFVQEDPENPRKHIIWIASAAIDRILNEASADVERSKRAGVRRSIPAAQIMMLHRLVNREVGRIFGVEHEKMTAAGLASEAALFELHKKRQPIVPQSPEAMRGALASLVPKQMARRFSKVTVPGGEKVDVHEIPQRERYMLEKISGIRPILEAAAPNLNGHRILVNHEEGLFVPLIGDKYEVEGTQGVRSLHQFFKGKDELSASKDPFTILSQDKTDWRIKDSAYSDTNIGKEKEFVVFYQQFSMADVVDEILRQLAAGGPVQLGWLGSRSDFNNSMEKYERFLMSQKGAEKLLAQMRMARGELASGKGELYTLGETGVFPKLMPTGELDITDALVYLNREFRQKNSSTRINIISDTNTLYIGKDDALKNVLTSIFYNFVMIQDVNGILQTVILTTKQA